METKDIYHALRDKKKKQAYYVYGSKSNTHDFVAFQRNYIVYVKIISPYKINSVPYWVRSMRKWHILAWYKCIYELVYIDENNNIIKEKQITLN